MTKNSNLGILFALGLIWSSFAVFTKIAATNLSPFFVTFSRLLLGGSLLYGVCFVQKVPIFIKNNFKHYLIVGFFNSALPFTLFALSSRHVDSAIAAILDGTVPMFEVLISIIVLKRFVDKSSILGVIFGALGIIVTYFDSLINTEFGWSYSFSVLAILIATSSYAAASLYLNEKCKEIDPMAIAAGSVFCAMMMLSPSLLFTDLSAINLKVFSSLLGLGILCTGFAYILYFRLIQEEGPRIAVSVVLLIPIFGTIFGGIFLGETITLNKIIGCLMILISMKFILNLSKQNFFKSKHPHSL